jgi:hypothetical protein
MGDRRKCQTYAASPAEPGGLPLMLVALHAAGPFIARLRVPWKSRIRPGRLDRDGE